jgi:hypothetical protein
MSALSTPPSSASWFKRAWDWFTGASTEYLEFVEHVAQLEAANAMLRLENSEHARWKHAVLDAIELNLGFSDHLSENPNRAILTLIDIEVNMALDPAISERAAALRDSWPVLQLEIESKEAEAYHGHPDRLTATKLFDAGFPVDLISGAPLFGHLTVEVSPTSKTTTYTWRRK